MPRRKKWKLMISGCLALALSAALLGYPRSRGPRAGENPSTALEGHRLPVQALAFSPDGLTLTSAAFSLRHPGGWEVAVWDLGTASPTASRTAYADAVRGLALAPDGALVATGQDRSLWLGEAASLSRRWLAEPLSYVQALALSADGSRLATADFANVVTIWDMASGRSRSLFEGAVGPVPALAFTPDGTVLAGGVNDTTVRLWDVATGEERGVLRGQANVAVTLAFSPDGRTLASGDLVGAVNVWDVEALTGRTSLEATAVKDVGNDVTALAFLPDGRTLAVAVDRAVQLWDLATGCQVANLQGHAGKVASLAISPDGTRLASGSHDCTVRLWDVARYRAMRPDPRP
jgi:WD40 repeat protein